MRAILVIQSGDQPGRSFVLDPEEETKVGRDNECTIVLSDPLSSRVHAVLWMADGIWRLRDAGSRNGTVVNGERVAQAQLDDGHTVRIGKTTLRLQLTEGPITTVDTAGLTQTIVQDAPVASTPAKREPDSVAKSGDQLLDYKRLYQFAVEALDCESTDDLVQRAMQTILQKIQSASACRLTVDRNSSLQVGQCLPEESSRAVSLSETLIKMVVEQSRAVWIASQQESDDKGDTLADALCAPLIVRGDGGLRTIGAIHIQLAVGRFRQSDFDFAIAVVGIVSSAWRCVTERSERRLRAQANFGTPTITGAHEELGPIPESLLEEIPRLARSARPVLLCGPPGVDALRYAYALHAAGSRSGLPLVILDATDATLFKGRSEDKPPAWQQLLEQADQGTLFVERLECLDREIQQQIHDRTQGAADESLQLNVDLIASTWIDISRRGEKDKFEENLFKRFGKNRLNMVPLQNRSTELAQALAPRSGDEEHPASRLSAPSRELLLHYPWPGNDVQLMLVLHWLATMHPTGPLEEKTLMFLEPGEKLDTLRIEDWERRLIDEALRQANNSVPDAAKLLGIGRATLYRKIEQYHVER